METVKVCTNGSRRQRLALSSRCAALAAAGLIASTTPAAAQTSLNKPAPQSFARAIEWNLPATIDMRAGAIASDLTGDGTRIWFVTRVGEPRVYRLELRGGKRVNNAKFLTWNLDENSVTTGGLKRIKTSKDQRFVFVRAGALETESIQRVNTTNCPTKVVADPLTLLPVNAVVCPGTTWLRSAVVDDPTPVVADSTSDLSVDDYNNVYAAFSAGPDASATDGQALGRSFIQKLNPGLTSNNVTRWYVGGGAGLCGTAFPDATGSSRCLAGVTVHPKNNALIYYAESTGGAGTGAIAELDTSKTVSNVRRWFLSDLAPAILDPRQVSFDNDGKLWCVTGSGHIVSLNLKTNRMTSDTLIEGPQNDLFGVAPDGGVIGYTAAAADLSKVAMLLPKKPNERTVNPKTATVGRRTFTARSTAFDAIQRDGQATPVAKTMMVNNGNTIENDRVVEALTSTATSNGVSKPSLSPLGIIPDQSAAVGTFFYAVGESSAIGPDCGQQGMDVCNTIGRIRLRKDFRARIERDDDDIDDDGKKGNADDDVDDDKIPNSMDADNDNDGTSDVMDDDDDDDGIEDQYDTPDQKETKQSSDQVTAAGASAEDPFTLNSGTLVVLAVATSSDPLAAVSCEILDATGNVVASSLPGAGTSVLTFVPPSTGGTYTLRVRNQSLGVSTISTKIITREPWPLPILGGL